jgi:hypothetical protein
MSKSRTRTHIQQAFADCEVGDFKTLAEIWQSLTPEFPDATERPSLSAVSVFLEMTTKGKTIPGIEQAYNTANGTRGAVKTDSKGLCEAQIQGIVAHALMEWAADHSKITLGPVTAYGLAHAAMDALKAIEEAQS